LREIAARRWNNASALLVQLSHKASLLGVRQTSYVASQSVHFFSQVYDFHLKSLIFLACNDA